MSEQRHGWERLAGLLVDRRIQLGPQYRSRLRFAADTGLNERLISDLENARRQRYRDTSLRAVEAAYRWEPGSIQRVLDGGDPVPMTPPGGFATYSEFPPVGVEVRGGETATMTQAAPGRRAPSWFASEVTRRGLHIESLTVEQMRSLAAHFGYTLAELLLNAGLAGENDLEISERPVSQQESEALAEFDQAAKRITSSPFLSDRQRRQIEELIANARQEALEEFRRDG